MRIRADEGGVRDLVLCNFSAEFCEEYRIDISLNPVLHTLQLVRMSFGQRILKQPSPDSPGHAEISGEID